MAPGEGNPSPIGIGIGAGGHCVTVSECVRRDVTVGLSSVPGALFRADSALWQSLFNDTFIKCPHINSYCCHFYIVRLA